MKVATITCNPVSGLREGNPNNTILDFERLMLDFLCEGKDYQKNYRAVLVDSATNAIELCCMVNVLENKFDKDKKIEIPNQTYVSVKNVFARFSKIELVDKEWDNYYQVHNIVDSAGYLPVGGLPSIFGNGFEGIDYLVLSFGNSKPFPMNKGGMIIFQKDYLKIKSTKNSEKKNKSLEVSKYSFLKRLAHDGRDSALKVEDDILLELNGVNPSMKCNLVPELVKDGLSRLKDYDYMDVLKYKHRKGRLKKCCNENYPKINKDI